jgi:hypothetical protein
LEETHSSLRSGQDLFRRCLEWLGEEGSLRFRRITPLNVDAALHQAVRRWSQDPRVKFLELHGVKHTGVGLMPGMVAPNPWRCHGIAFAQAGVQRDPLDFLCWHLICLHIAGDLNVRRCRYRGCRKFFEPMNARKVYCKDACRALDHKKSREEMKLYMRRYRVVRQRLALKRKN